MILQNYLNNSLSGNQQAYNAPVHQPQYNPSPAQPGAQLPAGVDAHACPNYPYCN